MTVINAVLGITLQHTEVSLFKATLFKEPGMSKIACISRANEQDRNVITIYVW